MACGRSSGMTRVSNTANTGATTKFSAIAAKTSRTSRKGARIARGLRLSPAASMLLTRNVKSAILAVMRAASVMPNKRR